MQTENYERYSEIARSQLKLGGEWHVFAAANGVHPDLEDIIDELEANDDLAPDQKWEVLSENLGRHLPYPRGWMCVWLKNGEGHTQPAFVHVGDSTQGSESADGSCSGLAPK